MENTNRRRGPLFCDECVLLVTNSNSDLCPLCNSELTGIQRNNANEPSIEEHDDIDPGEVIIFQGPRPGVPYQPSTITIGIDSIRDAANIGGVERHNRGLQGELGSTRTINVVLEGFFPNRPDDSLNEEELNRIPLVLISQKHLDVNLQCSICIDDYILNEEVMKLNCHHMFHKPCIIPWLQSKRTCPICRTRLIISGSA